MNLDELQAICDAATPGPWYVRPLTTNFQVRLVEWSSHNPSFLGAYVDGPFKSPYGDYTVNDTRFIVAAREYMPKLIAMVKKHAESEL